ETDYTADLYALKGKDEPIRIASDASLSFVNGLKSSILFFTDYEYLSDSSYSRTGSLYSFTYGDEEKSRVTSDVIRVLYGSTYNDPSSFAYLKYDYIDKDEYGEAIVVCKLCYYENGESVTLANDIID
ncbi:MAG TPA: hypothetical protein DD640_02210, partial [Clostridiales bacterium]|nr:hypothetical protein [Clostridiales bacterium]